MPLPSQNLGHSSFRGSGGLTFQFPKRTGPSSKIGGGRTLGKPVAAATEPGRHQSFLEGTAAVEVSPVEIPVDSGRTELVRCLLPLGMPTPAKAGAIGHASWLHGFHYCITALEPRHLDLIMYGSTYGVT